MNIVIFIAVFFSSIVGLQLFGISINKIALLPLEIYLLMHETSDKRLLINRRSNSLILWYLITIISTLSGLTFIYFNGNQYFSDALKADILLVVQTLFIYLPIVIMLGKLGTNKANEVRNMIIRSLIITARLQCFWALMQVILFYALRIDINTILFVDILRQDQSWTQFSNLANSANGVLMRPTGINHDAAFLGILLIIGVILDKKMLWRIFYFFVILLSFSRSALLTLIILLIYVFALKVVKKRFFINVKPSFKIKARSVGIELMKIAGIIIGLIIILRLPFIQNQLSRMIERIATISTGGDGTSRHTAYPIAAFKVLFIHYPIMQKLFGIGLTVNGVAFNIYHSLLNLELSSGMVSGVWSVECDYADVMLGTGIVGTIIYYYNLLKAYHVNKEIEIRNVIVALLVFGLMYNYCGLTFFQILLWTFYLKRGSNINSNESLEANTNLIYLCDH